MVNSFTFLGLKCPPMFVFAGEDPDPRLAGKGFCLNMAVHALYSSS